MMKTKQAAVAILLIFLSAAALAAQTSRAEQIIREMENREVFGSSFVRGRMVINDRFGEKISTFDSWSLGTDYSLIEFTSVEELGQKILRSDDDLYIYYPDAEEEIRLSGSALRDGILGSDVSYEDMTGGKSLLDDYRVTDFRTENLAGAAAWVIELEARRSSVPYPRQIIWIDQESGNGVQSEMYSLSDRLLKTERVLEFETQDGYVFPVHIVVQDMLKRNSSTEFIIDEIEVDVDIDLDFFSRENLTW
jgi:outer membrane lipoprotein-sorting protein